MGGEGGGLRKGRGYLFVWTKGREREECTCDNGGSRRGGNRASSDFLFVCAKEGAVAGGSETAYVCVRVGARLSAWKVMDG